MFSLAAKVYSRQHVFYEQQAAVIRREDESRCL